MKRIRKSGYLICLLVIFSMFVVSCGNSGVGAPGTEQAAVSDNAVAATPADSRIQAAMDVQNRHTAELMANPDVVGTATGTDEAGTPVILVFAKQAVTAAEVPESLEGIPVSVQVTGRIFAMESPFEPAESKDPSNTSIWPLPVPIGVSTGPGTECLAGTISAQVTGPGNDIYALSCAHVYALVVESNGTYTYNAAGTPVYQPGLYDTNCSARGHAIGALSNYTSVSFCSGTTCPDNKVDAAIAISNTSSLLTNTPSGGYGAPNSIINACGGDPQPSSCVGLSVQKYGRTTSLTKGTIVGINATVQVCYNSSCTLEATFVHQIEVHSSRAFAQAGDSGSLIVTNNSSDSPVGLLFAGNSSGQYAWANPISDVETALGVTINGK